MKNNQNTRGIMDGGTPLFLLEMRDNRYVLGDIV